MGDVAEDMAAKEGAVKWSCQGYLVDQSTPESIEIRLPVPKGTKGKDIDCKFSPAHLKVGLKGSPPLLDVSSSATLLFCFFFNN